MVNFVWKDYKYNRLLNGAIATSFLSVCSPNDLVKDKKNIILASEIDKYNLLESRAFKIGIDISEIIYGIEDFGKMDVVITDYNGVYRFAKSPYIDLFIIEPYVDSEDNLDFVLDLRRIEESYGFDRRPIAGYKEILPYGIVRFQNNGIDIGEGFDFYIGSLMEVDDSWPPNFNSAWSYSRKFLEKALKSFQR
ncbi:MAG: hypothetical protein QXD48_00075 [Candidatus Aenigmatarchaeota archaeon]